MIITKQFTAATYVFHTNKVTEVLSKLNIKAEWSHEDALPQVLTITVPDSITAQEVFSLGMLVQAYIK